MVLIISQIESYKSRNMHQNIYLDHRTVLCMQENCYWTVLNTIVNNSGFIVIILIFQVTVDNQHTLSWC